METWRLCTFSTGGSGLAEMRVASELQKPTVRWLSMLQRSGDRVDRSNA